MQRFRFLSLALALLACAASAAAGPALAKAAAPDPARRVTVTWTNPADFAEAREYPGFHRDRPELWLGQLAQYLQRRADRVLPPGERLSVTFTDVKRAGTYEPWRGPLWDDVRIVKDLYPPRIDLRFTLTDANGAEIAGGERTLRDVAFMSRDVPMPDDPLRYEKRLLDDWLRREFAARRR
jgi:hypothetical protein